MDAAFRTPLVDCFRRGEVPREARVLAARGALVPRAHEQIQLLMLLVRDDDPEVAAMAEATLTRLPRAPLAGYLARSDVPVEVKAFFAARGIVPAEIAATGAEEPLTGRPQEAAPEAPAAEGDGDTDAEAVRRGAAQRLALLPVSERMKVGMQGTREERMILVRDPNRLVAAAVLSSPKLTESEVEAIARMSNVSEDVLRVVGTTRSWVKNYPVIAALTRNPKTPVAISLTLLNRLTERDVKGLSTDRNVPEPIRMAARRLVMLGDSRRH